MGPVTQEGTGPPDEFAHLFRPGDEPEHGPSFADDFAPAPQETPQGGMRFEDPPLPESESVGEPIDEPIDEPAREARVEPEISSDPKEGRLFRSRGAPERDDALVAVGAMQARRLRTLGRTDESIPALVQEPVDEALAVALPLAEPRPHEPRPDELRPDALQLPTAESGEPAPALHVMTAPAKQPAPRVRSERQGDANPSYAGSGSLTGLGVYAVTIGVTLILALGETFFFGGRPGVITGIGLLAVSIFAAFAVRTNDGMHAIFAPAIAYLIVTLTAGQIGITGSGLASRAIVVFFLLGSNWIWIVGATAAALVIVALRRRVG